MINKVASLIADDGIGNLRRLHKRRIRNRHGGRGDAASASRYIDTKPALPYR